MSQFQVNTNQQDVKNENSIFNNDKAYTEKCSYFKICLIKERMFHFKILGHFNFSMFQILHIFNGVIT